MHGSHRDDDEYPLDLGPLMRRPICSHKETFFLGCMLQVRVGFCAALRLCVCRLETFRSAS
jgi:hypothetical protein